MPDLAFLHTGEAHIATFDKLSERLAPAFSRTHLVDASLLARAQTHGMDPALTEDIQQAMLRASSGARRVICTCSTIGEAAEQSGERFGFEARRIDRAMAKIAVESSGLVAVIAALESTLSPTECLLQNEASRQNKKIDLTSKVVPDAWAHFEDNDFENYHQMIADYLKLFAQEYKADTIVLAQASMAGAASLVNLRIPVLSSPALGLKSICDELR